MTEMQFIVLTALGGLSLLLSLAALLRRRGVERTDLEQLRRDLNEELRATRT